MTKKFKLDLKTIYQVYKHYSLALFGRDKSRTLYSVLVPSVLYRPNLEKSRSDPLCQGRGVMVRAY